MVVKIETAQGGGARCRMWGPMQGYVSSGAGWFTLSLVNAGLAQGKNRSGFNWWLLSLVLGPVATFLIVVWPAVEPVDRY